MLAERPELSHAGPVTWLANTERATQPAVAAARSTTADRGVSIEAGILALGIILLSRFVVGACNLSFLLSVNRKEANFISDMFLIDLHVDESCFFSCRRPGGQSAHNLQSAEDSDKIHFGIQRASLWNNFIEVERAVQEHVVMLRVHEQVVRRMNHTERGRHILV